MLTYAYMYAHIITYKSNFFADVQHLNGSQ